MATFNEFPIRTLDELRQFEAAMTLEQRLPERSVLDVFIGSAARQPERTAVTMIMTGAPDEQPRRVNYAQLLGMVRRSANLFHSLGGPRAGVAYMLPSLIETHATLWGAETAGYAVPINFLLQIEHIAALLEASDSRILVALGPHPVLDIWQKALALRERLPGLTLIRVAPPGTPAVEGVIDFHTALAAQPEDHLVFGEPGKDDDVAAYFHTGGTTGTPKLVAHTHRGQLTAAFGGAAMGNYRSDDVFTGTFPLFHVAGTIACGLGVFLAGMELLVMSPGGLRTPAMVQGFWRLVAQYQATLVGGVPTSMGAVLEVPLDGADISAVRAGITGAALLPPAVGNRFRQVTGCNLYEVYGMTEASGLIAYDPFAGASQAGSVGWALPYTRVEVRRFGTDGQLGEVCNTGEVGVVSVSGPHVSPGYRNPSHDAGIFDNGVLNALLGNFEPSPDRKGLLFEHLFFNQLLAGAFNRDRDIRISTYRTEHGAEVDFVVESKGEVWAVELKASRDVGKNDLRGLKGFGEFHGKPHHPLVAYLGTTDKIMEGIPIMPWQKALKAMGL